MKRKNIYNFERISSIVAAIILLQTLFFKFTAAPESVYIFSKLGAEPMGRIFVGVLELIAASLLLLRKTSVVGALVSILLMLGAIFSHIFVLGIVVQDDHGILFSMALVVLLNCAINLYVQRSIWKPFISKNLF